jgi:hypothetical protein
MLVAEAVDRAALAVLAAVVQVEQALLCQLLVRLILVVAEVAAVILLGAVRHLKMVRLEVQVSSSFAIQTHSEPQQLSQKTLPMFTQ